MVSFDWSQPSPERSAYYRERRRVFKAKKHGVSIDQLERDAKRQGGRCIICRVKEEPLSIDHEKKSGKYRGLLCLACNGAIGFFRDNPESCIRAARYLTAFDRRQQVKATVHGRTR